MFLLKGFHLVFKIFKNALLLLVIATILFIAYRGNQPMSVPQAPQGITYPDSTSPNQSNWRIWIKPPL
jgi:hypothetical protein